MEDYIPKYEVYIVSQTKEKLVYLETYTGTLTEENGTFTITNNGKIELKIKADNIAFIELND